jgi:hypothetical protein
MQDLNKSYNTITIITMGMDYLAKKNKHPRDDFILFDEGPHIYTIKGDNDYTSVTTWNHCHFSQFDPDAIISKMMKSYRWKQSKYYGQTPDEIKAGWEANGKEASEAGTKMHYDIECFYNNCPQPNDSIEYQYFNEFKKDYNLKPYRTEWMIYDEALRFAGSVDMLFENEDGTLEIYDWKRSKGISKENRWQSSTTECLSHLPDSNFWHYSLQLNTYKAILEMNYNVKIKGMYLVCLHPNNENKSYQRIKVEDMTDEINELFDLRREILAIM